LSPRTLTLLSRYKPVGPFFHSAEARWTTVWDWLQERLPEWLAWLREAWQTLRVWVEEAVRQTGYWFNTLKDKVITWIDDRVDDLRSWIEQLDQAVADMLNLDQDALSTWLASKAAEVIDKVAAWTGDFAEWLINRGQELMSYLVELGRGIGDWLWDKTQQWFSWLEDRKADFDTWLAALNISLASLLDAVSRYVDGKIEQILGPFAAFFDSPADFFWARLEDWIARGEPTDADFDAERDTFDLPTIIQEVKDDLPDLDEWARSWNKDTWED